MLTSRRCAAALVCVWLVASIPIAVADVLPLVDYPGHLVRVHLLAHWDQLHGYDEFYQPAWRILPNLGLELIAVPLAKVLPTELAMRLFCVLALGLLISGGAYLHRVISGRWTVWSFAPALLVYNHILAFGFLSFIFALGVGLFALALHIRARTDGRSGPLGRRVAREIAFMLALFFSHFVVLIIYLVAAAAYDALAALAERRPWKDLMRDAVLLAACALVPLLLLISSPTSGDAGSIEFSGLSWKVGKFVTSFETGQGRWDDLFGIATVLAILALLATRQLRVHWVMAGVTVALLVLFALAPYRLGLASNLDTRLPIVVLFAGVAALDTRRPHTRVVLGTLSALFLVRVGTTTVHYRRSSAELDRMRTELTVIPPGALVFTSRQASAQIFAPDTWNPPLPHASELLLLTQPFFSASLFALPTQHTLVRSAAFARFPVPPLSGEASSTELEGYAARMTARLAAAGRNEPAYVYLMKGPTPPGSTPQFEVVLDRPRFAIYRLVR